MKPPKDVVGVIAAAVGVDQEVDVTVKAILSGFHHHRIRHHAEEVLADNIQAVIREREGAAKVPSCLPAQ